MKREDLAGLERWESEFGVPIVVVHVFYDRGYFVRFQEIMRLLKAGEVGFESQKYTNPDGTSSTPKEIIKISYVLCEPFGTVRNPQLVPKTFVDKNGKVMTYVTFVGGHVDIAPAFLQEWG